MQSVLAAGRASGGIWPANRRHLSLPARAQGIASRVSFARASSASNCASVSGALLSTLARSMKRCHGRFVALVQMPSELPAFRCAANLAEQHHIVDFAVLWCRRANVRTAGPSASVGDQPGAGVRGGLGLLGGGVAVADADQHAGLDQPADRGERAGRSGASVCIRSSPGAASISASTASGVGVAQQRRVVRTVPVGGQERALDVHAEHPGAAEVGGQRRPSGAARRPDPAPAP